MGSKSRPVGTVRTVLHAAAGAFCLLSLSSAGAIARGAPDSFAELSAKLLPTVVNIATTQTLKVPEANVPDSAEDSALRDFFKNFLDKNKTLPRHVAALGSGFVIDASGLVVTNEHVIEGADTITVTLNDGSSLPAAVVGRDEKTDVALLRVHPKAPLTAAHFGDSDSAHIGDWVIAMGNPFGLGSSVTAGIVSARNRDISAGPYDDFIQTDASINRGNSGGPLFDMDGNVVGIASAIYSPSGGSVGVGFAMPSNLARGVIAQLQQYGRARRGWVGVRVQAVTSDIAESLGLPSDQGALVAEVTPNGPAAAAGVKNGDLITGINGNAVPDSRALPRMVANTPIGRTVTVEILRKGQRQNLRITVAQLEDEAQPGGIARAPGVTLPKSVSKFSQLGLELAAPDARLRTKYKLETGADGVVVTNVDADSPAADQDIQPGDVIHEVQNEAVHTPGDVSKRIDAGANSGRKAVLLRLSREGQSNYIALHLGDAG